MRERRRKGRTDRITRQARNRRLGAQPIIHIHNNHRLARRRYRRCGFLLLLFLRHVRRSVVAVRGRRGARTGAITLSVAAL